MRELVFLELDQDSVLADINNQDCTLPLHVALAYNCQVICYRSSLAEYNRTFECIDSWTESFEKEGKTQWVQRLKKIKLLEWTAYPAEIILGEAERPVTHVLALSASSH